MADNLTRRGTLRLLLMALGTALLKAGSSSGQSRCYRVDATILLLGIPVYRQSGVGAGFAMVESVDHGSESRVGLQFGAAADPAKAHGLQRFGVIRDVATLEGGTIYELASAGFMTDSNEKSHKEAEEALRKSKGEVPCTLVGSVSISGRTTFRKRRFDAPAATSLTGAASILISQNGATPDSGGEASGPHATFLYALWSMLGSQGRDQRMPYFYNGKHYTLAGAHANGVFEGRTLRRDGSEASRFKLWMDPKDSTALPTRIEFHARSFLRLTLETMPHNDATALPPVLDRTAWNTPA